MGLPNLSKIEGSMMGSVAVIKDLPCLQAVKIDYVRDLAVLENLPQLKELSLGSHNYPPSLWSHNAYPLSCIKNFPKLESLSLYVPKHSVLALEDLSQLPCLHTAHVTGHTSAFCLPFRGERLYLPALRHLGLTHCMALEHLSPDIQQTAEVLGALEHLEVNGCGRLSLIKELAHLKTLKVFRDDTRDEGMPLRIEDLPALETLYWVDPQFNHCLQNGCEEEVGEECVDQEERRHYMREVFLRNLAMHGNFSSLQCLVIMDSKPVGGASYTYIKPGDLNAAHVARFSPKFGTTDIDGKPL